MGISQRTRAKGLRSAAPLLPPGTTIRDYAVGRSNPRISTGAIVCVVVFSVSFVVALAFGRILIPGALLLIYLVHAVWPPRGVIAADEGVAVLERAFLNGRPTSVLAMIPAGNLPLALQVTGRSLRIHFGTEYVTLSATEASRLRAALGVPGPVGAS